jgi:hypothetical protein
MKFAAINIDPSAVDVPNKTGGLTFTNVTNIIQLVLGLAGAIAFIVITIAGLQYVLSQGNPQAAAKAKDTILYALVGLVICALGYAIVGFVVNNVS